MSPGRPSIARESLLDRGAWPFLALFEHGQVRLPAFSPVLHAASQRRSDRMPARRLPRWRALGARARSGLGRRVDEFGRRAERLVGDAHHGLGAGDVLRRERVAVGAVVSV